MVTQGEVDTTQAGLLVSSCSSWNLVFLAAGVAAAVSVPVLDSTLVSGWLWFCTRSMVAMGTGLEGTGMFSASIGSPVCGTQRWCFIITRYRLDVITE